MSTKRKECAYIREVEYPLPTGTNGKLAIFVYLGPKDPHTELDNAVKIYVGNNDYHEFIDSELDNPWVRVVISDINPLEEAPFDKQRLKSSRYDECMSREEFNKKMDEFSKLKKNWDGYGASKINKDSLRIAKELGNLRYSNNKGIYCAVPTKEGNIILEWFSDEDENKTIRFEVKPDSM